MAEDTAPARDDDPNKQQQVAVDPAVQEPDEPDDFLEDADEFPQPPDDIDARSRDRSDNRIQSLAHDRQYEKERADRLERELMEVRAQIQRSQQGQQPKEPTVDEMSMWSDEQRMTYRLEKDLKVRDQAMAQIAWMNFEANDKTQFQLWLAQNSWAQKYSAEVEAKLADLKSKGQTVERIKLFDNVIGEKMRLNRGKNVRSQREEAAERVRRQTTKPSQPSSDARSQRGKLSEREARIKRLENQTF